MNLDVSLNTPFFTLTSRCFYTYSSGILSSHKRGTCVSPMWYARTTSVARAYHACETILFQASEYGFIVSEGRFYRYVRVSYTYFTKVQQKIWKPYIARIIFVEKPIKMSMKTEQTKLKTVMRQLHEFFAENYEIRYSALSEQCEYRSRKEGGPFRPIGAREMNAVIMAAIEANIDCLDRDVKRYLNSSLIPVYEPIKDYLDTLPKWDGRDRIRPLAQKVSTERMWMSVFHRWMLGMVAQWQGRSEMHGNCLTPVLYNARQGIRKSTFCRTLLPPELRELYTDEFDVTAESNCVKKLSSFALINIDEINRMTEVKMARLKNILQMADVNICKPYQKNYSRMPRRASFIGTSNFREILTDSTGSRRFFPVEVTRAIRLGNLDYVQIYAQLKEELEHGKRYWLTTTEEIRLMKRNLVFTRRPLEETLFFSCFTIPGKDEKARLLSITEIYETLRRKSHSTMREVNIAVFGKHLAMMGVEKVKNKYGALYRVQAA